MVRYSTKDTETIAATAHRMVDVANQSLRIANDSKNEETRRSRLRIVRENVDRLKSLIAKHSFLSFTELAVFERSLAAVEAETDRMFPNTNSDVISHYEFYAHPSIRTPLTTLLRHGERTDIGGEMLAFEYGGWYPVTRSFRDIGIDLPDPQPQTVSSPIGLVDWNRYVRFLTSLKLAATGEGSIEERAFRIDSVCEQVEFSRYTEAMGGVRAIIDLLFPRVIDQWHFLPDPLRAEMVRNGQHTVANIDQLSDDELLSLQGMGRSRLHRLRDWCAAFTGDRAADRMMSDLI